MPARNLNVPRARKERQAKRKARQVFDLNKNAIEAIETNNLNAIVNKQQIKALRSNPNANTVLSKKKLRRMAKRVVVTDSQGAFVPLKEVQMQVE